MAGSFVCNLVSLNGYYPVSPIVGSDGNVIPGSQGPDGRLSPNANIVSKNASTIDMYFEWDPNSNTYIVYQLLNGIKYVLGMNLLSFVPLIRSDTDIRVQLCYIKSDYNSSCEWGPNLGPPCAKLNFAQWIIGTNKPPNQTSSPISLDTIENNVVYIRCVHSRNMEIDDNIIYFNGTGDKKVYNIFSQEWLVTNVRALPLEKKIPLLFNIDEKQLANMTCEAATSLVSKLNVYNVQLSTDHAKIVQEYSSAKVKAGIIKQNIINKYNKYNYLPFASFGTSIVAYKSGIKTEINCEHVATHNGCCWDSPDLYTKACCECGYYAHSDDRFKSKYGNFPKEKCSFCAGCDGNKAWCPFLNGPGNGPVDEEDVVNYPNAKLSYNTKQSEIDLANAIIDGNINRLQILSSSEVKFLPVPDIGCCQSISVSNLTASDIKLSDFSNNCEIIKNTNPSTTPPNPPQIEESNITITNSITNLNPNNIGAIIGAIILFIIVYKLLIYIFS